MRAGAIRAAHYDRDDAALSLADCAAAATTEAVEGVLVTSDADLHRVAGRIPIRSIPILNSRGVRPG